MTKEIDAGATGNSLRTVLFGEIQELQKRKGDPRRALAVASLAKQIVGTVRLDMEYARLRLLSQGGDVKSGTVHPLPKRSRAGGVLRLTKARSSGTHQ